MNSARYRIIVRGLMTDLFGLELLDVEKGEQ